MPLHSDPCLWPQEGCRCPPPAPPVRQWQCPCGAWVDMNRPNHIHQVGAREPTREEMIMARRTGNEATALQPIGEISEVRWQPHFPRRAKPNE